jgi:Retroviral aspartyl protease
MLDSGSIHSFISPIIMQILSLRTISSSPLIVITASGTKLSTSQTCAQLLITLQSHIFMVDLRVLQGTAHDIILGMDWIKSHYPLTYDGNKGELCLTLKGNPVTLYIKPVTVEIKLCKEIIDLNKTIFQGKNILIAQLFSATTLDSSYIPNVPA